MQHHPLNPPHTSLALKSQAFTSIWRPCQHWFSAGQVRTTLASGARSHMELLRQPWPGRRLAVWWMYENGRRLAPYGGCGFLWVYCLNEGRTNQFRNRFLCFLGHPQPPIPNYSRKIGAIGQNDHCKGLQIEPPSSSACPRWTDPSAWRHWPCGPEPLCSGKQVGLDFRHQSPAWEPPRGLSMIKHSMVPHGSTLNHCYLLSQFSNWGQPKL